MIARDPDAAATGHHDLTVVGGGVHGVSVALAAARRGQRVLLLESADFGSGASGNSLRILHGGLRYLQTLDLTRFHESVVERRWYARHFPALVAPLPCLMPLYAQGLKRRSLMRMALTLNDRLSRHRNDEVAESVRLPASATFDASDTQQRFAAVRRPGLEGAALWYDYRMRSSERILIEMLHWCCRLGVQALNHVQVEGIESVGGKVAGVTAVDRLSGRRHLFRCDRICNATGSHARAFAQRADRDHPPLFVPSLAFNVLFDCVPQSMDALAIAAPEPGSPVYFLCPSPFGLWAGTEHVGRPDGCVDAAVSAGELDDFIQRINRAIPSIRLSAGNVRRVCSGLLPVKTAGSTELTARECIVDHGATGGPQGLFSVTGIKFTTGPKVGARAAQVMFGSAPPALAAAAIPSPISPATGLLLDGAQVAAMSTREAAALIRQVARDESVSGAEDFCLRRTNWAFSAPDYQHLERVAADALA